MNSEPVVWFLVVGVILIVAGAGTWGALPVVPGVMVILGGLLVAVSILALLISSG